MWCSTVGSGRTGARAAGLAMIIALRWKAAGVAAALAMGLVTLRAFGTTGALTGGPSLEDPVLVRLSPGSIAYRVAGNSARPAAPSTRLRSNFGSSGRST